MNNTKLTKFETRIGTFYCSNTIDNKAVNYLKKDLSDSHHQTDNLKLFINNNSIVFDVGAHIGTFSIPLSTACKKVYSFEPNRENIRLFEKNVIENKRNNIELIKKPVTEKVMEVGFVEHAVSSQSHVSESRTGMTSTTLDSLGIVPDLIKIDIEGYEFRALLGAENVLKSKPVLYVEYVLPHLERAGNTTKELNFLLKERGYKIYLLVKDNIFVKISNINQVIGKSQTSNLLCISIDAKIPQQIKTISYMRYFLTKIKPIERTKRLLNKFFSCKNYSILQGSL